MDRSIPDLLAARVEGAISEANPAALARTDQVSGIWRDFFRERDLDLSDPAVGDSALRTMTMVYGMTLAAFRTGQIPEAAFNIVADIIAAGSASVVLARQAGPEPDLTALLGS